MGDSSKRKNYTERKKRGPYKRRVPLWEEKSRKSEGGDQKKGNETIGAYRASEVKKG